ncbi:MAG: tripartite tricarboxylate transporter TctB family protein [Pseudomonadota bacterium]
MRQLDDKTRIGALLLLAFTAVYALLARRIPVDALDDGSGMTSQSLPFGLVALSVVLATIQLVKPNADRRPFLADHRALAWRPVAFLVLLMVIYAITFPWLGFVVSSVLFLWLAFFGLGAATVWRCGVVSLLFVGALWALLTQVFGLYLDPGALMAWAGSVRT